MSYNFYEIYTYIVNLYYYLYVITIIIIIYYLSVIIDGNNICSIMRMLLQIASTNIFWRGASMDEIQNAVG